LPATTPELFRDGPGEHRRAADQQLVAGYDTYDFKSDGGYPEVVDGLEGNDFAGHEAEFFLAERSSRTWNQ